MLEIGALRQGIYESIPSFWAKIQKYGDQLGYTPAQKKTHFLSGVRPDIRDEIYRIGQTKPINDIIDNLAELELHHGILQQAPSQPRYAPIAPAISDIEKLKAELQAQQPQVATVGNFQPPPKFYPIKSEKPQQAFYIVDQEGNNMDPLTQDSDYLKYLEQAKALYKKPQRSNQSVRMDRIEEGLNKTRDTINQETGHSKGKCPNQPTVQSNYTRSYFTSLKPIYSQYTSPNSDDSEEDEVTESKQNEKVTMPNLFSESDNQLLELLSSAMRKKNIDPSTKNKWAESLEYMQYRIEDIIISDGFANTASGCLVMNKALNEALGWNLGMAPNFSLRHNSDHIMKLEGGHKDVPISIKYKNKWVTETGHVVVIDDGKLNYLLCLGTPWIRKPIKDNVLSSLYTTVIQNNNQTFDSSTKIDTKEEPASNEKKESQASDSFTEDLKKKI
ncbi:16123_t:CDS:2 [Cetraspora pellucida]|uniref:16123_t:CDS:1 n=1 Tax=Cetraspora pellucida TaxID=1433469 RepID=A0A9N9APA7_9GLOM|nr:16123_t:CDS:2 [Cetraspora pellucida]